VLLLMTWNPVWQAVWLRLQNEVNSAVILFQNMSALSEADGLIAK